MAEDDTGGTGTVLGFPRVTIPGAVGDDPPPAAGGFPALSPLGTTLAPPASLSVQAAPDVFARSEAATENQQPGISDDLGAPIQGVAVMSTVMMAGVAVAALRGAYHVAAYFRARQEHHQAIADKAGKTNSGAGGIRPRMQSGPEFGRMQTRNSGGVGGGSGSRLNTARNGPPATFRSGSPPPRTPGGSGSGGPNKAPGGTSGSRRAPAGTQGRGGLADGRRTPLNGPGGNGSAKGRGDRNSGVTGAVRDRAADRIRNGPAPRPTSPSDRTPKGADTIRGAARNRVADRINTGSWQPSAAKGGGGKDGAQTTAAAKTLKGPDTLRGAMRNRVADRITTGSWEPVAPKGGGKGGVSLTKTPRRPDTIRGALRARAADYISNWPNKPTEPDPAAAPGPKVDLTKKPKPAAAYKVDLTKKPKPKAGTGAGTGPSGPPPGPGTTAPPAAGAGSGTGPGTASAPPGPSGAAGGSGPAGTSAAGASGAGGPSGPGGARSGGAAGPGFGPPPGWGHTKGWEFTGAVRADAGPGAQVRRPPAGAITRGRPALPARPAGTKGAGTMSPNTQYADADLTIYDVIDSDADMAEEIMQGADDARQAAEDCEVLMNGLEALHAKIQDLKVPGVLEGLVLMLWEKAAAVKAKAEAIAEKIPAASEAIAQAGEKAAQRHKPLADAVRDAGHTAPAERDYHNE